MQQVGGKLGRAQSVWGSLTFFCRFDRVWGGLELHRTVCGLVLVGLNQV